nr:MAG TPA: hypothetical protein [Caudoviricetes sp.]
MTKAGIRLIFRSKEPEELSIGVYGYKYSVSPLLTAKISSKSFNVEDRSSVNQNTKTELKFDVSLVNDSTDRINRISHILYMGSYYKVGSIRPYPPRLVLTIEDMEISELKDQLVEVVKTATQKSQNDLKLEAYEKLGIKEYVENIEQTLNVGALVLKDETIQLWDGHEFKSLLKFISEKVKVEE